MEENLQEKLINKKENGWETIDEETKKKIFEFAQGYMNFLNKAKTEREFIVYHFNFYFSTFFRIYYFF